MMNYRMTADYHTHTTFSHGHASIEDNVRAALALGIKEIGISDHGPGHINYGIKRSDIPLMRKEVETLKKKYSDIKIFLSVEANVLKSENGLDIRRDETELFDYLIAGYHYGVHHGHMIHNFMAARAPFTATKGLMIANTEMVVKALYENEIKIITHPGDKGPLDIAEVSKTCEKTGTWMEVNTHHHHMNLSEIKEAAKYDVKFVISSDAHVIEKVGDYEWALAELFKAGVDSERIVNIVKED